MNASFFMDGVRNLFGLIDSGIYNLISIVYELIIKLSNITFFSEANIREVRDRIYVFLAVFMLFKVTISLITYLVDPDSMGDKTNGIGNVAKNVVITLFLIIIVPFGFDLLYEAQNAIISDNLIPRVILGTKGDGSNVNESYTMDSNACKDGDTFVTTTINSDGDLMAYLAFRPFYQTYKDADISSIKNDYCSANSVSNLLTSDIYNAESGTHNSGQYLINYQILLSTACGILVFLLLLNFAFDIAARTIKLGFLEIIAPIPILSYIDPKSSKDGPFKKWLSEVGKTWASLFIRLAIVYFAIYAIKLIPAALEQANDENGIWVSLFLLIGILIFAKNAIPLIENLFGIKFDHTVQLNPFKKISEQAAGGVVAAGLGASVLGSGTGGISQAASNMYNFARSKQNLKKAIDLEKDEGKKAKLQRQYDSMNARKFVGTTFGGLAGGALNGAKSGYATGAKGSGNVFKNVKDDLKKGNTSRNNRQNISDYNREARWQFDKTSKELNEEREAILNDSSLTSEQRKEKLNNIAEKIIKNKNNYDNARYGWVERNITENLDKNSGVKNDFGGYGYYNKKIEKLNKNIENNDQREAAFRTSLSQFCVSNSIDQLAIEELHKKLVDARTESNATIKANMIAQAYTEISTKHNIDSDKLKNSYASVETTLNNIDTVDEQTKQFKAERANYKEMMAAREDVKK